MGNKDIEAETEDQERIWSKYNEIIGKKVDFRTWIKWEEETKSLSLI